MRKFEITLSAIVEADYTPEGVDIVKGTTTIEAENEKAAVIAAMREISIAIEEDILEFEDDVVVDGIVFSISANKISY